MKKPVQRPLEVSVPGKSQEEQGLCDQSEEASETGKGKATDYEGP